MATVGLYIDAQGGDLKRSYRPPSFATTVTVP
jgi:hypothetical protein